jgi:predicted GNAT superfamily acetyltransferase
MDASAPVTREAKPHQGSLGFRLMAEQANDSARAAALAAFHPGRYGFQPLATGWVKELADLGPVVIAGLGWQHAQLRAHSRTSPHDLTELDALELVVDLQRETWGMAPEELVPANVLAVLSECGGSLLVAYRQALGFTRDGWLGFAISMGSNSGALLSHMLGVRAEARGRHDIGWYLKVVQGYEALRQGYRAAHWTFDPMRGANGRLNLEKLGAVVRELTIDKYGTLGSELYGAVPTDRFTADWDLLDPATARRLHAVADRDYQPPSLADTRGLTLVTAESVDHVLAEKPPRLGYQVPGDIDRLMQDDPAAAIAWRREMRQVLSRLLTTKSACLPSPATSDPTQVGVRVTPGAYVITGIATGLADDGERRSIYLLQRDPMS